jgi:hypothetical protein
MSYEVTEVRCRFASTEGELPPGRVAAVIDRPGRTTILVRPGHATQQLLDDMTEALLSMTRLGQWLRLSRGDKPVAADHRVTEARWDLVPRDALPVTTVPLEQPGKLIWLVREGEASRQLVAEMTELLTELVAEGLWLRRWDQPAAWACSTASV